LKYYAEKCDSIAAQLMSERVTETIK
jgi:hypothetical protein